MIFSEVLAGKDYAAGRYESIRTGILIPVDANKITVSFARDAWDTLGGSGDLRDFHLTGHTDPLTGKDVACGGLVTEVARGFLWVSLDGGATWSMAGMIGMAGGAHVHSLGHLVTASTLTTYLPVTGGDRLIRVTMDVMKGVRTKADIEALAVVRNPTLKTTPDEHHSVAFEATSAGGQATAATSVGTGNVTPTGSDRVVFISGGNAAGGGGQAATWTWDGGAVTAENWDFQGATFYAQSAAYKTAPAAAAAAGTQTVGANADDLAAGAIAFSGVDQTTPFDTPVTETNTGGGAPSLNVTTTTGDMVVNSITFGGVATLTAATDNTVRWEEENVAASNSYGGSTRTGNGTVATGYTETGGNGWLMGAVNINQSSGAAAVQPTLMLMGIGS